MVNIKYEKSNIICNFRFKLISDEFSIQLNIHDINGREVDNIKLFVFTFI